VSEPAIELEDVSLWREGERVLDQVSLRVAEREFLAVLGPNGSGKTTMLLVILGALVPEQGRVRVLGTAPRQARPRVGYVPQRASFERDFPIRVLDVALMGRIARCAPGRRFGARDLELARLALARMGVDSLAERPIGALSGGELQRVLIARALAGEPELLLLDEPTASLDERMESGVWELLEQLSGELAIVMVSHDIGAVARRVQRVACLNRRLVVHAAAELTPELLEQVYGAPLRVLASHDHRSREP
jgi:zinc transport system ATP-binding protein